MSYIVRDVERKEWMKPMVYPGSQPHDLGGLRSAKKNILISSAAVPFARMMERIYGIQYQFYNLLASPGNGGHDALIVGEQVRSNIIRSSLAAGGLRSDVATMFTLDERFLSENDSLIHDEDELRNLFRGGYKRIIADPLLKPLMPEGVEFVPDPQPAVSTGYSGAAIGIGDIVGGRMRVRSGVGTDGKRAEV